MTNNPLEQRIELTGDCFQRLIMRCVELEIGATKIFDAFESVGQTLDIPSFGELILDVIGHPKESELDIETNSYEWCRDGILEPFYKFTRKQRTEVQITKFSKQYRRLLQAHVIDRLAEEKIKQ